MKWASVALHLACACAPCVASAQQGDTLVVTLGQALEIARLNNPAYSRAVNDLELNAPAARAAWVGEVLPSVTLNLLSTGYSGRLTRRATDFFGNPIDNPTSDFIYTSDTQQGIGLGWQLRGPSIWNHLKRLSADNQGRNLAETVAGEQLRRGFFDALEQEELLTAERAVADASRSDLETAERLYELALRTRVDVLQAELQIQQQALAVRLQVGRRDQAMLELRKIIGQSDLRGVRPAATPAPLFDPSELESDGLVARAMASSARVRQAEAALRSAEIGVGESASYWPTVTANLNVGRYVQAPEAQSLFQLGGFGDDLQTQFTLRLSLPFFNDVLGNRLAITRAEVQRENQRDELREARLEAEQAARSALVALRDRWESLQIVERSLSIAAEALELAREEYRLGVAAGLQPGPDRRTDTLLRREDRARLGRRSLHRVGARHVRPDPDLLPRLPREHVRAGRHQGQMEAYSHTFTGAEVRVYGYGPSFYGGGSAAPNYSVTVLGYNYEKVRDIADDLGARLAGMARIGEVDANASGRFTVDRPWSTSSRSTATGFRATT